MKSASSRPEPVITPEFASWWDAVRRHALEIQRCGHCRAWIHYPRVLCPHCFSDELAFEPVNGSGHVVTWSVVHRAQHPDFADEVPYAVVVAEMAEGFRLLANVSGIELDELRTGMPVCVSFCDFANGVTLPVFVFDPTA